MPTSAFSTRCGLRAMGSLGTPVGSRRRGYGRSRPSGEPGTDLTGVWHAELGIQGEGVLPVAAGLIVVTAGVVGVRQVVVGAGPLVAVADLAGQGQGVAVPSPGLLRPARGDQGLTNAVERLGFAG